MAPTLPATTSIWNAGTSSGSTIGLAIDSAHSGAGSVSATAGGNITLTEVDGDLSLGQVASAGGDVNLTAAGKILNASGGSAANIVAPGANQQVVLSASGIGNSNLNRLQLQAAYLEATAGTGSIWLNSLGNLTIGKRLGYAGLLTGLTAGASIDLTGAGALTVAENVNATNNISLADNTAPVAGENFILNSGVTIGSTIGTVTIKAGTTVTVSNQSTIRGTALQITTGNQLDPSADNVYLYQLPFGVPTTVTMLGQNSLLQIQGTATAETFTVSSTQVQVAIQSPVASASITYSGVTNLVLNGLDGNDSYIVNSTSATNLTQINSGNGNNSLVVNASTRQNTPVEFVGGTANTTIAVNGSGAGDTIVAYNDPNVVQGAHVVGAGIQLQYTTQAQLNSGSSNRLQLASQLTLAENTGNNTIYVLGSVAPTVVQGSGSPGGDNLDLGGNGTSTLPAIPGVTFPGNLSFENLAFFFQPVSVVGSGTDSLTIDDSQNQAESATLTATTFSAVKSVTYSGISSMNLFLGGGIQTAPGTFSVLDTIGGPGGIKITPQGGYLDLTISKSETPITITNKGTVTNLTLDARAATSPLSNIQFLQSSALGEVTGLGPVGNVFFSGLQLADIELGTGSDRMTINENVPTTTFQINGNQGDDFFTVLGIGTGATFINGDSGNDTVYVQIPGNPAPGANPNLHNLQLDVENLIVDNTGNTQPVNWVVNNGELSANIDDLLSVDGAQTAQILGGSGANTLNITQQAGSVNATIDTDHVNLVSGKDVLSGGSVGTYNDFSDPSKLVQFGSLVSGSQSYTENGFAFQDLGTTGTGTGQLDRDTSISSALKTGNAQDVVELSASDGGFFQLYQVSFSGVGTVTFTGTTADGVLVSQTINVSTNTSASSPRGFTAFPFPSSFTAARRR